MDIEKKVKRVTQYTPLNINNDDTAMLWSSVNFYPKITFILGKTKDDNGELIKDNIITISTTSTNILNIITNFRTIVSSKTNDACKKYEFHTNEFTEDGKMTGNMIYNATLTIGKDIEGINYIQIEKDNKVCRFNLLANNNYFKPLDDDNNPITDLSLLSKYYTYGYLKLLEELMLKEFTLACTYNQDN